MVRDGQPLAMQRGRQREIEIERERDRDRERKAPKICNFNYT